MREETPGIGHNMADQFEIISDRTAALVASANAWLERVKEITDLDTAKACEDFLNQVKAELAAAEVERKRQNKPLEDQVKANNDRYRPVTTLLEKIKALMTPLKTSWLLKESQRLEAERHQKETEALKAIGEAEAAKENAQASVQDAVKADDAKRIADAAVSAAVAASNVRAQVRGNVSARASGLRVYWAAQITDYAAALQHYGEHQNVRSLIQMLADADARSMKDALSIPGVTAVSEKRAA